MQPDEYGVCVTSGYPIFSTGGTVEGEAIVYQWGGRTVARFLYTGPCCREIVEQRARAWIAATDATRVEMQATERMSSHKRGWRWANWWRDA